MPEVDFCDICNRSVTLGVDTIYKCPACGSIVCPNCYTRCQVCGRAGCRRCISDSYCASPQCKTTRELKRKALIQKEELQNQIDQPQNELRKIDKEIRERWPGAQNISEFVFRVARGLEMKKFFTAWRDSYKGVKKVYKKHTAEIHRYMKQIRALDSKLKSLKDLQRSL